MKNLFFISILFLSSCVNYVDRQNNLQKLYPKNVITPATSLLSERGYEFLMEDTITNQIYAVKFYLFSTEKISEIRNIK